MCLQYNYCFSMSYVAVLTGNKSSHTKVHRPVRRGSVIVPASGLANKIMQFSFHRKLSLHP